MNRGCSCGAAAGRVGFGRDLGATRSLTEGDGPGQAMAATTAALVEAERTLLDPLRRFKIWRKVSSTHDLITLSAEDNVVSGQHTHLDALAAFSS